MAKVQMPAMSEKAQGKLGDNLVFTNTTFGPVVRIFTKPLNPQTPLQMANRLLFGAAAKGVKAIKNPSTIQALKSMFGIAWRAIVLKYSKLNFDTLELEFEALDPADQTAWTNAATALNIPNYTLGNNTAPKGAIFWATASTLARQFNRGSALT